MQQQNVSTNEELVDMDIEVIEHSISCSAISFDDDHVSRKPYYRGATYKSVPTLSSRRSLPDLGAISRAKQFAMSFDDHSNVNFPVMTKQPKKHRIPLVSGSNNIDIFDDLQSLDIMTLSLAADNDAYDQSNSSPSLSTCTPPPSLAPSSSAVHLAPQSSFNFRNELNSFLVKDTDSMDEVLSRLEQILSDYEQDTDFTVDRDARCIRGVVFMSLYHAVWFNIQVWTCSKQQSDEQQIGFEFRRQSGDCMASAKFWSSVQSLYRNEDKNECGSFIALELDSNFSALKASHGTKHTVPAMSKTECDDLNFCLSQNDLFALDEMCILYQRIQNENGAQICADIRQHKALFATLMSCLLNSDIAVQRLALLILREFDSNVLCSAQTLFDNVSVLVSNGTKLIRSKCLQFLSDLTLSSQKWNFREISKQIEMNRLIKEHEIEFENDSNLDQAMFANIKRKLAAH